jgi:hypothetical protein
LNRRKDVELFEAIRREYQFGVGTIKGVARKLGVHRRMVREALADAVPKERMRVERARPRLEPAIPFIDAILENDLKAPRKQRHTAHRVYDRLRAEKPEIAVAEATVRAYVREKKLKIGLIHRETFVPQSYTWGHEGQVDWYEMYAELGGETQKVQMFCLRSMASAGAFHRAYPHASQQAFLEAHELAFHYFGGNLSPAALRQLEVGGAENPAWIATGGDGAVHRLPLALELRGRVLQSGARQREGWRGRRRRVLPAESSGAGSGGARLWASERAAAGSLPAG